MLHIKFRGNRSLVPEIFKGVLIYMGVAAILVMYPRCCDRTFVPKSTGITQEAVAPSRHDFKVLTGT